MKQRILSYRTPVLQLTQDERVALFQEWVLPLFIFPARAYFLTDPVVAKISVIYKVALRLNSWGLTLPIMALPPLREGTTYPNHAYSSCGSTPPPLCCSRRSHRECQQCPGVPATI